MKAGQKAYKKVIRVVILAYLLSFSWNSPLLSQSENKADSLSLSQCLKLALKHSPSLRNFRILQQAAGIAVEHDRALIKPRVVSAFSAGENKFGDFSFFSAYGGIGLIIDLPKRLGKFPRIAEINQERYTYFIASEEMYIVREVKKYYFSLAKLGVDLESILEGVRFNEHHLKIVQALYESGQKSKLDLLNTKNEIIKLNEQKEEISRDIEKTHKQLAILLGRSPGDIYAIHPGILKAPPKIMPLESFIKIVEDNNPSIKLINNEKKQLSARIILQKKANYPMLQIDNRLVFDRDPTAEGNYYSLNLRLSFPVFDWGKRKLKEDELVIRQKAKQREIDVITQYLKMEITELYTELKKHMELITFRIESQKIAREASEYAEISYQSGFSTNTEVLETHRNLVDARLRIDESKYEFMLQLAKLEYFAGVNIHEKNK